MDAYPATQPYITENLSPPGIEQRLDASQLKKLRRSPLDLILAQASPKTDTGTVDRKTSDISSYNPREEFRNLGWEVYDESGLPQRNNRTYMAKLTPDEFKRHLDGQSGGIKDIFSESELIVLARILDGDTSNHEMRSSYITTSGELALLVRSPHEGVGIKGSYYAFKRLTQPNADRLRGISHSYR